MSSSGRDISGLAIREDSWLHREEQSGEKGHSCCSFRGKNLRLEGIKRRNLKEDLGSPKVQSNICSKCSVGCVWRVRVHLLIRTCRGHQSQNQIYRSLDQLWAMLQTNEQDCCMMKMDFCIDVTNTLISQVSNSLDQSKTDTSICLYHIYTTHHRLLWC